MSYKPRFMPEISRTKMCASCGATVPLGELPPYRAHRAGCGLVKYWMGPQFIGKNVPRKKSSLAKQVAELNRMLKK